MSHPDEQVKNVKMWMPQRPKRYLSPILRGASADPMDSLLIVVLGDVKQWVSPIYSNSQHPVNDLYMLFIHLYTDSLASMTK